MSPGRFPLETFMEFVMIVYGFHSIEDLYSFENELYFRQVKYERRGETVIVPNPPSWIKELIEYLEVKTK